MDRIEAFAARLAVGGHLSIMADHVSLNVEFRDNIIHVFLPDFRSTLALWKRLPRSHRKAWLRMFHAVAIRSGLELHIHLNQHQIARLAFASRPRWFATALGLDPLEIDAFKLFLVAIGTSLSR
jgi:hypothetical protein